jgi:hypothetical protein
MDRGSWWGRLGLFALTCLLAACGATGAQPTPPSQFRSPPQALMPTGTVITLPPGPPTATAMRLAITPPITPPMPPPTVPFASVGGTVPAVNAMAASTAALPTPLTPPAITLVAVPAHSAAPFTIQVMATIPAGISTGCEAWVVTWGDGSGGQLYIPCGVVVSPAPPGATPAPIGIPTFPPLTTPQFAPITHQYAQAGSYTVQFALRDKPSDRIIGASNRLVVTVP